MQQIPALARGVFDVFFCFLLFCFFCFQFFFSSVVSNPPCRSLGVYSLTAAGTHSVLRFTFLLISIATQVTHNITSATSGCPSSRRVHNLLIPASFRRTSRGMGVEEDLRGFGGVESKMQIMKWIQYRWCSECKQTKDLDSFVGES